MKQIFVDTDVLIDYSKGHSRILQDLLDDQDQGRAELCINPVVVAEFMTDRTLQDKEKYQKAEEFLQLFLLQEITKNIGLVAGKLLRDGAVTQMGDAMIAATCLAGDYVLATRNKKHFQRVSGVSFY